MFRSRRQTWLLALIILFVLPQFFFVYSFLGNSDALVVKKEPYQENRKGVILTSYFTTLVDPQRNVFSQNDHYDYMAPLYDCANRLQLNLIIFHDNLSTSFTEKYSTDLIQFVHIGQLRGTMSMNDERFLFYHEYLRTSPIQYEFVLLADVSDVTFTTNPFHEFERRREKSGCELFIARETDPLSTLSTTVKKCYSSRATVFLHDNFSFDELIYNAGVVGGSSEIILLLLDAILREFIRMDRGTSNCNTPALQFVLQNDVFFSSKVCSKGLCWKDQHCESPYIYHKVG